MSTRPPELLRMPPMNAMQLLDAGVRIYRENFLLFAAISMIPTVPLYLLQLASLFIHREHFAMLQNPTGTLSGDQWAAVASLLGSSCLFVVVEKGFGVPIAAGALTTAISNRYLGVPVSVGSSFRPVFRRFGSYILTTALVSLVLAMGLIASGCSFLLLSPLFCMLWVWFMCTPCVQILEGTGGIAAMTRSRELSRGYGWPMIGASLWLFFVYMVLMGGLPQLVGVLTDGRIESPVLQLALQQSVATVIGTLLDPFWSILRIMFYYDLRIRKEGYDLAINGQRLAAASPLVE